MPATYAIKEIFPTLQGEGHHAGTAAVFVRFAGCNMWSGREATRAQDAERNRASCALWCDTDFVGGEPFSAGELASKAVDAAESAGMLPGLPLIVFTGGEPLLQLDAPLLRAVREVFGRHGAAPQLAIETNGRTTLTGAVRAELDWVCVSPKGSPEQLLLREGDELKLVHPAYDPAEFDRSRETLRFRHWYLQPEASPYNEDGSPLPIGGSRLDANNMAMAAAYCMKNPGWRLSVQIHKVIDLP